MIGAPGRTESSGRASDSKIDSLTSLRFFAALAIVIHHMSDFGLAAPFMNTLPLDNGVSFFFMLSGFVMFLVYADLNGAPARKAYLVARIARIYPLHIVTFALLFVLLDGNPGAAGVGEATWLSGILNVLLLQAWIPIGTVFFGFNSVSWTISVEMFFYVAFVLLVVDFRRRWPYALCGSALLVVGLAIVSDTLHLANYDDLLHRINAAGLLYINPLARLFEFVLGMCIALAWRTISPRMRIDARWATLAEIGALTIFLIAAMLVDPVSAWVESRISASLSVWVYHGGAIFPATALVIFVFAFQAGLLSALLRLRVLVFLGEISFSIYLVHQILLRSYALHIEAFRGLSAPATIALYLAVVLLSSALLWRFVEVPARWRIRNAYRRRTSQMAEHGGEGDTSTGLPPTSTDR